MNQASSLTRQGQVCVNFLSKLQELQQCGHLCDLKFQLKNATFQLHKVVMSAWSPVIHNLLKGNNINSLATIKVQYDNTKIFGSFLALLYSGHLDDVAELYPIQILHLATSLQIRDLREICEEVLRKRTHFDNIIHTCEIARKYQLPDLEGHALNLMQMDLTEAVKQAEFLSLTPARFRDFLSGGLVNIVSPEVKLFLIISWLGYDVKQRQPFLTLLLQFIDWSTVAETFLRLISQTENFFTTNESSLYLLLQTLYSSKIDLGPYGESFLSMRTNYAYLLNNIVKSSDLPVEKDDYFPVSFSLVTPELADQEDNVSVNGSVFCQKRPDDQPTRDVDCGIEVEDPDQDSCYQSDPYDLNDSFLAGISLGMKKVAVMEYHVPVTERQAPHGQTHSDFTGSSRTGDSGSEMNDGQHEVNASSATSTNKQSMTDVADSSTMLIGKNVQKRKRASPDSQQKAKPTKKACLAGTCVKGEGLKEAQDAAIVPTIKQVPSDNMDCVSASKPTADSRQEKSTSSTRSSQRPKRQAAIKFSVPKKLVPCARKNKELLKPATILREAIKKADTGQEENTDSVSETVSTDSDEEGGNEVEEEDSAAADPDYSWPTRQTKSKKYANSKIRIRLKHNTKTKPLRNNKTSVKVKKELLSMEEESDTVCETHDIDVKSEAKPSPSDRKNRRPGRDENKRVKKEDQSTKNCPNCGYSTLFQYLLDNHIKRVHGNKSTLYVCSLCSFECQWNKGFYQHMKTHFHGPPFTCEFENCGFKAQRIQGLLIHRRLHVDVRPHKCTQCSLCFRTRNNLTAHLKCHSEEKEHECPVCHRRFRMKNTLEQHMVTHSNARPYLCDICGFSTKFQSHLNSHKRTHTGEVFTCSFANCSYSSPKRSQMKAHMRSHLNVRQHTCHICQSAFIEKSHLVRHLKIHQNVRPHRCDQCEYSSTRVDKVNEHKRKYHSEETASCSKRQYKYKPRYKKGESKLTAKMKTLDPQPNAVTHVTVTKGKPSLPNPQPILHNLMAMPLDTAQSASNLVTQQICLPPTNSASQSTVVLPQAAISDRHIATHILLPVQQQQPSDGTVSVSGRLASLSLGLGSHAPVLLGQRQPGQQVGQQVVSLSLPLFQQDTQK